MGKPKVVAMLEAQLPKNPRVRVIDLEGQIDANSATKFCRELNELIEEDKIVADFNQQMQSIPGGEAYMVSLPPIRINITTPGGYIYWGCMILDALDECIAKTHMHVRGLCASMGIPILCKGNLRSAGKHATFMIHGSSTGLWGYTDDLKGQLQYQEQQDALLDKIVLDNTKVTAEQMEFAKVRSWFFGYDEAFKLGVLNKDVYQGNHEDDEAEEEEDVKVDITSTELKDRVDNLYFQIGEAIKGDTLCSSDIIEIETWVCDTLKVMETLPQDEAFYELADALEDLIAAVNSFAEERDFYQVSAYYWDKAMAYLDIEDAQEPEEQEPEEVEDNQEDEDNQEPEEQEVEEEE